MTDVTKIVASGNALTGCKTGEKACFRLEGAHPGQLHDFTNICDGPKKMDMMWDTETPDKVPLLYFVPLIPGGYKVTIRYRGKQIPGSPFTILVNGETINAKEIVEKVICIYFCRIYYAI